MSDRKMPNDAARVRVRASELPMHCPMPDAPLWNSHPRVYIPLGDSPDGVATCEYCGTVFELVDELAGASLEDERPPSTDARPVGTG